MKILSIDVGMKNLAYCIVNYVNKKWDIEKWDIINLCNEKKYTCLGCNKKNEKCTKPGKYYKLNESYCKIHAKNKNYKIPTSNYNLKSINKANIKKLKLLANEYDISCNKKFKKKDYVEAMTLDLSNNYWNTVNAVLTKDMNLVDYGINLKKMFDKTFSNLDFDYILIENQIGPLALRMKSLQGMIMQHFIEKNQINIIAVNSINKLKDFLGNKKTTYSERKKEGIKICKKCIMKQYDNDDKWNTHFDKHKKKDDLADCFLQCLWFMNNKL